MTEGQTPGNIAQAAQQEGTVEASNSGGRPLTMKGMMIRNASIGNSVPLTRSDQTWRICFTDVEAVEPVETSSFPDFSARDHSARLRRVLVIARL